MVRSGTGVVRSGTGVMRSGTGAVTSGTAIDKWIDKGINRKQVIIMVDS